MAIADLSGWANFAPIAYGATGPMAASVSDREPYMSSVPLASIISRHERSVFCSRRGSERADWRSPPHEVLLVPVPHAVELTVDIDLPRTSLVEFRQELRVPRCSPSLRIVSARRIAA
jgi:hypothetical protein